MGGMVGEASQDGNIEEKEGAREKGMLVHTAAPVFDRA